jgi:hypothetical protein
MINELLFLTVALGVGALAAKRGSGSIVRPGRIPSVVTRRDLRSYRFYVVNWDRRSGSWPILESGFAEPADAERRRFDFEERLPKRSSAWSQVPVRDRPLWRVVTRQELSKEGFAPAGKRAGNLWMKGTMVGVDASASFVEQVRAAVHNVNLWTFGRPFEHAEQAIVVTRDHPAAFEWAPESEVVVFREYGLPSDFGWWRLVGAELDANVSPLRYETVNDAVVAFFRG